MGTMSKIHDTILLSRWRNNDYNWPLLDLAEQNHIAATGHQLSGGRTYWSSSCADCAWAAIQTTTSGLNGRYNVRVTGYGI